MLFLLAAEPGETSGIPENPILPATYELFWGAVAFGSLYLLIRYVLLPPVQRVMNDRAATIQADLDAADDPEEKLKEIEDRLNKLRSPHRTAEAFWVEEIIDPRDTRKLLCEFAELAEPLRTPGPRSYMMRP